MRAAPVTIMALLASVVLVLDAGVARAHGGNYTPFGPPPRGPSVGPGGGRPGPTTPGGRIGRGAKTVEEVPTADEAHAPTSWKHWWYANRDMLIARKDATLSAGARDERTRETPAWDDAARAALRAALGDADEDIASGAAIALGRARDTASTLPLIAVATDGKRAASVREAAALALGLAGSAPHEDSAAGMTALIDLAQDRREDTRLRALAAYAIALCGGTPATETLLALSGADPGGPARARRWDVPAAATSGLGIAGGTDARAGLDRALRATGSAASTGRVYASQGLARLADADAAGQLLRALERGDGPLRRGAALALGALPPTESSADVVAALTKALTQRGDGSLRGAAALSLGRVGGGSSVPVLVATLEDEDASVRPFAALALGLTGAPEAERALLALLDTPSASDDALELRRAAACALALARAVASRASLTTIAAERGDPELRAHAAFALGLVGDSVEAPQVLREMLVVRDHPAIAREAAWALGRLRDPHAPRLLRDVLTADTTQHVHGAAAVALGRILGRTGDAAAAKALIDVLSDPANPAFVRAMAAVGLGHALDRDGGNGLREVAADLDWMSFTDAVREVLTIL